MSKRKKTRQQKIISDLRRKTQPQSSHPEKPEQSKPTLPSYSFQVSSMNSSESVSKNDITATSYPFLIHDLKRTGILTFIFIAAELLLFFLLKQHIVKLPMISY